MKQLLLIVSVLLSFLSSSAIAEEASKTKLLELAKATGIYEQIEEQKIAIQQQSAQAAQQYTNQIRATMPELPAEFNKEMERELSSFMENIAGLIDTDFAVNSYVSLMSTKLNNDDVKEIVKFYNSSIGKKYTQANVAITGEWTKTFLDDLDKKVMAHFQTYVQNLSEIATNHQKTQ